MSGDGAPCLRGHAVLRQGARRTSAPWLALASGVLAAVLPKCPVCVGAYLSMFGVSLGAAGVTFALLRSLSFAMVALALGLTLVGWSRRQRA
jgi:hypothetical protein